METPVWLVGLFVVMVLVDRIRFETRIRTLEKKHEGLRNAYGAELTRLERLVDRQAAKLREVSPPRDGDAPVT